ncbi:hypothetical protein [Euzebya pacifica]|nr:hypothetical protein [Euzebya pacifica]
MHTQPAPVLRAAILAMPDGPARELLRDGRNPGVRNLLRQLGVRVDPKYVSGGAPKHVRTLLARLPDDDLPLMCQVLVNPMVEHARTVIGPEAANNPTAEEFDTAVRATTEKYGWQAAVVLVASIAMIDVPATPMSQAMLDGYADPDDGHLRRILTGCAPGTGVPDQLPGHDATLIADQQGQTVDAGQDDPGEGVTTPLTGASLFTPLDRTLIRAAVGSAIGAEKALSRADLVRQTDELILSTPDRARSWFHSGFVSGIDAQAEEQPAHDPSSTGANDERRHWWMIGRLVGARRAGDTATLLAEATGRTDLVRGVIADRVAGADVTAAVCEALLDGEDTIALAAEMLAERRDAFDGGGTTIKRYATRATVLVSRRDIADARRLVEAAIGHADGLVDPDTTAQLGVVLASTLRAAGDFDAATDVLNSLPTDIRSAATADVAVQRVLCATDLRFVEDVPSPIADGDNVVTDLLASHTGELDDALVHAPGHPVAALLAGYAAFAAGDHRRADAALDVAVSALDSHPALAGTHLPAEAAGHRGIAALRSAANARDAIRHLSRAVDAGWQPPTDLLVGVAEGLVLGGPASQRAAGPFLTWCLANAATRAPFVGCVLLAVDDGVTGSIPTALGLIDAPGLTATETFDLAESVLRSGQCPDGRYDDLVALAADAAIDCDDAKVAATWLELLDNDDTLRAHLGSDDVDAQRIALRVARGEPELAAAAAHKAFWRHVDHPGHEADPEDLLELVDRYGANGFDLDAMRRAVRVEETVDGMAARLAALDRPVRVLFIGGKDADHERVRKAAAIATEHTGVAVEVEWQSGWDPRWPDWCKALSRRSGTNVPDAAVVLRLMRTTFGRTVRPILGDLGVPWQAAWQPSINGYARAISGAVAAFDRMTSRS